MPRGAAGLLLAAGALSIAGLAFIGWPAEQSIPADAIISDKGSAYVARLQPWKFVATDRCRLGVSAPGVSSAGARGRTAARTRTRGHDQIRQLGSGRYSHWSIPPSSISPRPMAAIHGERATLYGVHGHQSSAGGGMARRRCTYSARPDSAAFPGKRGVFRREGIRVRCPTAADPCSAGVAAGGRRVLVRVRCAAEEGLCSHRTSGTTAASSIRQR